MAKTSESASEGQRSRSSCLELGHDMLAGTCMDLSRGVLQDFARREVFTHVLRVILLPFEPLEPVSLKHDLRSPRSDHNPIEQIGSQRSDDHQSLMTLFASRPVWLYPRGRNEIGVEPQMRQQQGRGGQCLKREI